MNGLIFGGGIAALEIFVIEESRGHFLRRVGMLTLIGVTTVVWALLIIATLETSRAVFGHPWGVTSENVPHNAIVQDVVFAFAVGFLVSFLARLRNLVGPGMLISFLTGHYAKPVREKKVVLFVDLANSTALAEKLGDLKVQSLISSFFLDVSDAITEYDGEIHQYIGDSLVVTWPQEIGIQDAKCLRCIFALRDKIEKRSQYYLDTYGTVPSFRAGLHCGFVVVAEVGDVRRAIALFGDTMNTAARLEQSSRSLGYQMVASGTLVRSLEVPDEMTTLALGDILLPGKEKKIHAFAIVRAN